MALDRRKVTMKSISLAPDGSTELHQVEDYVDVAHIDAYVADAQTRWQVVNVSEEPDHGPGGADGSYTDVTN